MLLLIFAKVIFISLVYAGNVANMAIPTMVMTRPIVFRERGSNAYRLCPYYWAVLIAVRLAHLVNYTFDAFDTY